MEANMRFRFLFRTRGKMNRKQNQCKKNKIKTNVNENVPNNKEKPPTSILNEEGFLFSLLFLHSISVSEYILRAVCVNQTTHTKKWAKKHTDI